VQQHRVAALHVAGAAAEQPAAVDVRGHVVGDRHGVEVAGEQHPALAAEGGAGDHDVAVTDDVQRRHRFERLLDEIGDRLLRA
jgi:hypothetical protein